MRERRPAIKPPPDRGQAVSSLAVLGLRDTWLLSSVGAAVGSSGFAVADVATSANQLLSMTAYRRPRLVVASLEVLGQDPAWTVRRTLTRCPDVSMVVLSPLDMAAVWLLEAGTEAVVPQSDITALKRVLRDLHLR